MNNSWLSHSTCEVCNQRLEASGHPYGDVFLSCTYCGWFSEEEDGESTYLNAEPTVKMLVEVIDLMNHLQSLMKHNDTVNEITRAVKACLRTNVNKDYCLQIYCRDDDGGFSWEDYSEKRFATKAQAIVWKNKYAEDEPYNFRVHEVIA